MERVRSKREREGFGRMKMGESVVTFVKSVGDS